MPAAAAAAVLLASGCGGGSSANPVAAPSPATGSPSPVGVVLDLTGTEYTFAPMALTAKAGKTTIRFTNKGALEHDFVIDALKLHVMAKPGKTAEATVTLKPGTYQAHCSVAGHRQSGMQGTLTVS